MPPPAPRRSRCSRRSSAGTLRDAVVDLTHVRDTNAARGDRRTGIDRDVPSGPNLALPCVHAPLERDDRDPPRESRLRRGIDRACGGYAVGVTSMASMRVSMAKSSSSARPTSRRRSIRSRREGTPASATSTSRTSVVLGHSMGAVTAGGSRSSTIASAPRPRSAHRWRTRSFPA